MTSCSARRRGTTSSSPTTTVRRCGFATSAGRSTAPENTKLAAWADGKRAVLLAVMKQPGANVIDTVDRIKAMLPQLQAAIPPAVKVDVRQRPDDDDPSLGHRRAVHVDADDRARRHGDLPLPAQLLGHRNSQRDRAAWRWSERSRSMYVAGFSLDNLSLMGLSIAVGFVVDDAIVMLENIQRHIEEGLRPIEAAHQGRRRDRIHHHVDQPVAGRGVHSAAADGRHRRPDLPRIRRHGDDDHCGFGVRGADAHAGDGGYVPAERSARRSTAVCMASERMFDGMLARLSPQPRYGASSSPDHARSFSS